MSRILVSALVARPGVDPAIRDGEWIGVRAATRDERGPIKGAAVVFALRAGEKSQRFLIAQRSGSSRHLRSVDADLDELLKSHGLAEARSATMFLALMGLAPGMASQLSAAAAEAERVLAHLTKTFKEGSQR